MKNNKQLSTALWSDCETDEERVKFLQSGRAWETGIIAKSIQHEVALAFHFRSEGMAKKCQSGRELCEDCREEYAGLIEAGCCPNCGSDIPGPYTQGVIAEKSNDSGRK